MAESAITKRAAHPIVNNCSTSGECLFFISKTAAIAQKIDKNNLLASHTTVAIRIIFVAVRLNFVVATAIMLYGSSAKLCAFKVATKRLQKIANASGFDFRIKKETITSSVMIGQSEKRKENAQTCALSERFFSLKSVIALRVIFIVPFKKAFNPVNILVIFFISGVFFPGFSTCFENEFYRNLF